MKKQNILHLCILIAIAIFQSCTSLSPKVSEANQEMQLAQKPPMGWNRYLKRKATSEDSNIVKRWFANSNLEHELYEKSLRFWEETPLEPNIKG